jgi:signal transduction histidine kinase
MRTPIPLNHAMAVTVQPPDGRTLTVARKPVPNRIPSFLPLTFCFITVGTIVYLLATDRPAGTAFFGVAVVAAVALIAAIATPIGLSWALAIEFVGLVGFPASLLIFTLVFPRAYVRHNVGKGAALLCLLISLVLLSTYLRIVIGDGSDFQTFRRWFYLVFLMELLSACILLALACIGRSSREREARRTLVIVALGAAMGFVPFCLLVILPTALGGTYLVRPDMAILPLAFLPVSIGAAVLRRQLMGIDRVVRRSLVALLVWGILTSGYVVGFILIAKAIGDANILPAGAVALAIATATYPLAERWVRRACERLLFHDVYDYSGTLRSLAHELVQLRSMDEVASHALTRLGQTLDLAWAAITFEAPEMPASAQFTWGDVPADFTGHLHDELASPMTRATSMQIAGAVALVLPLAADGVASGYLAIGPKRRDLELSPDDRALIATLVPLLATIFQNVLLVERLSRQVTMLNERDRTMTALSARLMQVQEEERHRLALDLHDDPLQRAILLAREVGADSENPLAQQWRAELDDIIAALRALSVGLRPPALDDFGLPAGLERLVHNLQAQTDLAVMLRRERSEDAPPRLEPDLEVALYRVAQEAVNNVLKHAEASRIDMEITQTAEIVRLTVADDGHGLHPQTAETHRLALGILGMHERLRPWEGSVTVANRETHGTLVTAEVHLHGRGLNGG